MTIDSRFILQANLHEAMAMQRSVLSVLALVLVITLASVLAQPGMPKKVKKEHKCSVCKAVVKELIKKTGPAKKRTESKVLMAVDDICEFENFRVYDFPPPVMVKACGVFMGDHEDAVSEAVTKQGTQTEDELVDAVCLKQTKVCKGVNLEEASKGGTQGVQAGGASFATVRDRDRDHDRDRDRDRDREGGQVYMDNNPMGGKDVASPPLCCTNALCDVGR